MIQDIGFKKFDIAFSDFKPERNDFVLRFDKEGRILVGLQEDGLLFTRGFAEEEREQVIYLFSLDQVRYFLLPANVEEAPEGFAFKGIREIRGICPNEDALIAFTAYHLWWWYRDNHFCGRCAGRMKPKGTERALVCESCGNTVYPRINPAVIVGVVKGDCLLITRYRTGYAHNALVAGFTEIGETLEETVAREVLEETGVKVKNVRYYKSQPWGMAQDILVGYFCEADGDARIRMDESELKYAQWVKREDIELQPNNLSLTNDMMRHFKENIC